MLTLQVSSATATRPALYLPCASWLPQNGSKSSLPISREEAPSSSLLPQAVGRVQRLEREACASAPYRHWEVCACQTQGSLHPRQNGSNTSRRSSAQRRGRIARQFGLESMPAREALEGGLSAFSCGTQSTTGKGSAGMDTTTPGAALFSPTHSAERYGMDGARKFLWADRPKHYPAFLTRTTVIFSKPSSKTGGLSFSAILRMMSSLTERSRWRLRCRQTSSGTSKKTAWTS